MKKNVVRVSNEYVYTSAAKLCASTHELSLIQEELAKEQKTSALYRTRVSSLNSRLEAQSDELKKSMESHGHDKKKLDVVGEHALKVHEEIKLLKMEVTDIYTYM